MQDYHANNFSSRGPSTLKTAQFSASLNFQDSRLNIFEDFLFQIPFMILGLDEEPLGFLA